MSFKFEDKPCERCEEDFTPTGGRSKYCPPCKGLSGSRAAVTKRRQKIAAAAERAGKPASLEDLDDDPDDRATRKISKPVHREPTGALGELAAWRSKQAEVRAKLMDEMHDLERRLEIIRRELRDLGPSTPTGWTPGVGKDARADRVDEIATSRPRAGFAE